jgi:3-methyladenine DNA glycosylase Tag
MKNFFILLLLGAFSVTTFSQNTEQDFWDKYTNPGTNNYYYQYFSKYLTTDLIAKEKFTQNQKKITVAFNISKDFTVFNAQTNASNPDLKEAILSAFKNIDFSKVIINEHSTYHNYSIQLIENINGTSILKCSASVLHEVPTILTSLTSKEDFKAYTTAFNSEVRNYLFQNIDSAKVASLEYNNKLTHIKIKINKNGNLSSITNNSDNAILNNEINNTLSSFNFNFIKPALLNGYKENYTYEVFVNNDRLAKSWFYKTSDSNDLSLYFKSVISNELLQQEVASDVEKYIWLFFGLDKKNRFVDISTSSKNTELNEQLIKAFKNYPISKLKMPEKVNIFNQFSLKIIALKNANNKFESSNYVVSGTLPVVKGCEKSQSFKALKKCNQRVIRQHISKNLIKNNLSRYLNYGSGKIITMFKISKNSLVTDIEVIAGNEKIKNVIVNALKSIEILSSGYQNGVPVNVKYALPIAWKTRM